MALRHAVNDAIEGALRLSRRLDRFYRDGFDRLLRPPIVAFTQFLINATRRWEGLGVAEERAIPDEDRLAAEITATMCTYLQQEYRGRTALRAGNTKTHGLVRGRFEVFDECPEDLREGVFREPGSYPAWVRFAGPGPAAPADLDDNGILSISVKVMGVPGLKLLPLDERWTQDFTGISAPTFTTPDVRENLKLQRRILDRTPALYFLNPLDPHLLDAVMQGVYSRAHGNPLDLQYYSCVPYLHGAGRAVKYAFRPRRPAGTKVPRRPPADYLRAAMAETLRRGPVEFDFLVQTQTDPDRMPIENASVIWPERLSPYRAAALLHIPRQEFGTPAQMQFDRHLSFNPWHALPEHRPLGNQNRARRVIYETTSRFRQQMNRDARIEPTGDEVFAASSPAASPTRSTP